MDLFEVTLKGEIVPSIQSKEIPELKAVLDKGKSISHKEIQYLWHLCNSKSPYEAYGETSHREEVVRRDFINIKGWEPD